MWFVDRFWTPEKCSDIKYETGSCIAAAILKFYMTSLLYSAAGGPIWMKFGNLFQNSTQITAILSKSQREEEF